MGGPNRALWGDNCYHAVRSKRDPRQKAGHLLHSSRPALRSEFRGCTEELSGAVAPNLFWTTRRQRYAILPCRWRCGRQIWKDRPGSFPCTSCRSNTFALRGGVFFELLLEEL